MYLANKVQNIQGSADTLLDLAGLEQDEIRPVADAMERGGRLAAKELVTRRDLDKCKPIAGTPAPANSDASRGAKGRCQTRTRKPS